MLAVAASAAPYHAGELAVQRRAGVAHFAQQLRGMLERDSVSDTHAAFLSSQPLVVVATVDARGYPWARRGSGFFLLHAPLLLRC